MKHLFRTMATSAILAATLSAGTALAETKLKLVEVITSPARTETLNTLVSEYEANNPDVDVEIISLPWGEAFEKLSTMVAGGEVPDVVEMPDAWLALYAGNDMLLSLEDAISGWEHGDTLAQKTLDMARLAEGEAYTIPYGFYLRAMFYNKKLLAEAGVDGPPHTMEEFMEASRKVSELPGKSGYCLRGGGGGLNAWIMYAATMNGSNEFFTEEGESRLNEPGSIEGLQFLIDMYQKEYAPYASVNWGFNEIVAGFYSGTCAFLDQDPDALISVAERMDPEDFAVTPMPVGPSGKAFPTIGFAGWSVFNTTEHQQEAVDLVQHLSSPEANLTWTKQVGVIPIHEGAEQDSHFATPQYKGWFDTLNGEEYIPTIMPVYLKKFGVFKELAISSSQEALLGERTAEDLAEEWATFLTTEYKAWKAAQ